MIGGPWFPQLPFSILKTRKSHQDSIRLPQFPQNFDDIIDDVANQKARKVTVQMLFMFIADSAERCLFMMLMIH